MPMLRFPCGVLRWPQTIACQHAFVQPSQLFHHQGLHGGLLASWNVLGYAALNAGERIALGLGDDLAQGLSDQVAPGQAQRIGFRQVLLDGQIFLRRSFIGPYIKVAQQLYPGHFIHAQGGAAVSLFRHVQKSQRTEVGAKQWQIAGQARGAFVEAMNDDLNISKALAALFDLVHDGNKRMDAGTVTPEQAAAVESCLAELDRVLGFLQAETTGPDSELMDLAQQRLAARKSKNWAEADRIRDVLAAKGWEVQDTPEGPKLKRKG